MTTQTKAQLRKMDDVTLLHVLRVTERCLNESKAEGRKDLVAYWQGAFNKVDAEAKRRVAAEAQQAAPCPHDWKVVTIDGSPFAQCCACRTVAVAVVMR